MVKRCRVLLNNRAVTVIKYDDIEVQLPSIGLETEFVNVKYDNGRYEIVPDEVLEEPIDNIAPQKKKRGEKKTTKEETDTEAVTDTTDDIK